jgi:hypothetical protein
LGLIYIVKSRETIGTRELDKFVRAPERNRRMNMREMPHLNPSERTRKKRVPTEAKSHKQTITETMSATRMSEPGTTTEVQVSPTGKTPNTANGEVSETENPRNGPVMKFTEPRIDKAEVSDLVYFYVRSGPPA